MVWRMSPYERRRGGNALPGGLRGRSGAGNARAGQRGSGHSAAMTVGTQPDSELGSAGPASWRRGDANSTMAGRRVRQHRSFASRGKARPDKYRESRGQNRTREIRPSGIVERLQETWPVGMFSTRRARLISISTESRWPRPCVGDPRGRSEALDRGARRPAIEPRKGLVRGADAVVGAEGNIAGGVIASRRRAPRGRRTRACVRSLHAENREISRSPALVDDAPSWMVRGVADRLAAGREGNAKAVLPR